MPTIANVITVTPAKTPSPMGSTAIDRPGSSCALVVDSSEALTCSASADDDEEEALLGEAAFESAANALVDVDVSEDLAGESDPDSAGSVVDAVVVSADATVFGINVVDSRGSVLSDSADPVCLPRCDERVDVCVDVEEDPLRVEVDLRPDERDDEVIRAPSTQSWIACSISAANFVPLVWRSETLHTILLDEPDEDVLADARDTEEVELVDDLVELVDDERVERFVAKSQSLDLLSRRR